MSKHEHTKGPWKAHSLGDRYGNGDEIFEIHWSDDGECVAEIVHGEPAARLIAAAPELLETLEWVDRMMRTDMNYEYALVNKPDKPELTVAMRVRDMIAKANVE